MVPGSNAVVDPRAVMVEDLHAFLAVVAVFRSFGLRDLTLRADLEGGIDL